MKTTLKSKWSLKSPLYLKKSDKRYKRHLKQLKDNGFSDSETWGLDSVIAEFILPRLKRFKEVTNGFPSTLTEAKWDAILDDMIFAFEWDLLDDNDEYEKMSEKEKKAGWDRYNKGIRLFAEYFRELWW